MKTRRRRRFSAKTKSRIALEAIKRPQTVQEIASHYRVYPNRDWKRWLGNGSHVRIPATKRSAKLDQQIGQLQVESDIFTAA